MRGVVVVGEALTKYLIKSEARGGVTCSTRVNAGRMRTVVGCWPCSAWWYSSGTGMLEAESLSLCRNNTAIST